MQEHKYLAIRYMLSKLDHFKDLGPVQRQSCLHKVVCVVTSQDLKSHEKDVCSLGAELLTEILSNWERGIMLNISAIHYNDNDGNLQILVLRKRKYPQLSLAPDVLRHFFIH